MSDGEDVLDPGARSRDLRGAGPPSPAAPGTGPAPSLAGGPSAAGAVARLTGSLAVDSSRIRREIGWSPPFRSAKAWNAPPPGTSTRGRAALKILTFIDHYLPGTQGRRPAPHAPEPGGPLAPGTRVPGRHPEPGPRVEHAVPGSPPVPGWRSVGLACSTCRPRTRPFAASARSPGTSGVDRSREQPLLPDGDPVAPRPAARPGAPPSADRRSARGVFPGRAGHPGPRKRVFLGGCSGGALPRRLAGLDRAGGGRHPSRHALGRAFRRGGAGRLRHSAGGPSAARPSRPGLPASSSSRGWPA